MSIDIFSSVNSFIKEKKKTYTGYLILGYKNKKTY